jgi:predicted RNA binding protein YcfA (HicA-like mRNA interferase family)
LQRIRGSHHIYTHPDKPQILTVPVHANQDLKIATMQLNLAKEVFKLDPVINAKFNAVLS